MTVSFPVCQEVSAGTATADWVLCTFSHANRPVRVEAHSAWAGPNIARVASCLAVGDCQFNSRGGGPGSDRTLLRYTAGSNSKAMGISGPR